MALTKTFIWAAVLVMLASLLACRSGVPQEQHDQLASELEATKSELQLARQELDSGESQLQTLTTQMGENQRHIERLEGQVTDLQDKLREVQVLANQRERTQKAVSAYLDVALGVLEILGREPSIDEMAKLSSLLLKLEDETYEDLTTRLLRTTDPREAQVAFGSWLFYTFQGASAALEE